MMLIKDSLLYLLLFSKLNMLSCRQVSLYNDIMPTYTANWDNSRRCYGNWRFQLMIVRGPGMEDHQNVGITANTFQKRAAVSTQRSTILKNLTLYLPISSLTVLPGSLMTNLQLQSTGWESTLPGHLPISWRRRNHSTQSYTE